MKKRVEDLLTAFVRWAEGRPDIAGAALVGSYGCGQARTDSDVDLVILTATPEEFIHNQEWINEFGEVMSCKVENWGRVTSLRVFYQDGLEVEYGITTTEWAGAPLDEGTRQVIAGGMQILLDKTGVLVRTLQAVRGRAGT